MCFSSISEKQLVYHCHCTSQLYPSSLNPSDKAEPRCLLPSFLTGHQHSSTDCIIGVNNQTNQYVMPSTGFLLSCLSFRSSPFEHCSFLIHIYFFLLYFPFPVCYCVGLVVDTEHHSNAAQQFARKFFPRVFKS